jgi:adenylosuccinate synthase
MSSLAVVGTQWGDEGKGKFVDFLAEPARAIVRFQGGDNAGHTVKVGPEIFKLHIMPSGILRKGKLAVIGNGVIINPKILISEIDDLERRGISCDGLRISDRAHLIMPYHILLDGAEERLKAGKQVGTTGRGIGPCYSDKVSRIGIRMSDLIDERAFMEKLSFAVGLKNRILKAYDIEEQLDCGDIAKDYLACGKRLSKYVTDTSSLLRDLQERNAKVLFEGAQGCMLDVDWGTYPFVTSSTTVAGNISSGSGVPPGSIDRILGVAKAYTTRVGAGPFPTELPEDQGLALAKAGGEFGTTTGRMRRCGWLDLVVVSHAVKLSGIDCIGLTKMDVLGVLDEIRICDHYVLDDKKITEFPSSLRLLEKCEPAYKEFDSWGDVSESRIGGLKKQGKSGLPKELKTYVSHIEKRLGIPVSAIGLGKERDRTIVLRNIWPN